MNSYNLDYQKVFESEGFFVIVSTEFNVVGLSDLFVQISGKTRDKILGKNFFEIFKDNYPENILSQIHISFEKIIRTGLRDKLENYKFTSATTSTWVAINTPIKTSDPKMTLIIHRLEDVTKFVKKSEEYKVLEEERDLFFSHSFDLFAVVSSDGHFKRVNPAFERIMGYTEEELYSKPVTHFLHPDDVGKTQKGIQKLSSGMPTIASENRYRCKDGTYRWFSWNTTPLGPLFYTVGRDITAQVKAEECIKQLNFELEKKNEDLELKIQERVKELQRSEAQVQQLQKMDAIGRLAGGIAHDFNNMLSTISLYCDLLADDTETDSIADNVKNIRIVTERAASLTRQLLVFSRKQIVQLKIVNLNPLIQQLEKMLVRLIGENIKIILKLSEELKKVSVDPSQMEQVILNLVVNARDAMPHGGKLLIETTNVFLDENFTSTHLSVNRGPYVLLSVSDTGTGMETETLKKIFEPFFTTKPLGKGTGLGLTTTYGIVKQCQGTIWVYSELGKGTVFKIYLPVAKEIDEEPEIVSEVTIELVGEQTILFVEDDENLRVGFAMMLEKKGYKVFTAEDGAKALAFLDLHEGPIHLLVTDVVMPGMNGFDLANKAKILRHDLRLLYMSGYTNDALENSGKESLSDNEFIQKPFSTGLLLKKVQSILNISESE